MNRNREDRRSCIFCGNHAHLNEKKHYHNFPLDEQRRKQWAEACGLRDVVKTAKLCEDHFTEADYIAHDRTTLRKRLKFGALPSKWLFKTRWEPYKLDKLTSSADGNILPLNEETPQQTIKTEPQFNDTSTPEAMESTNEPTNWVCGNILQPSEETTQFTEPEFIDMSTLKVEKSTNVHENLEDYTSKSTEESTASCLEPEVLISTPKGKKSSLIRHVRYPMDIGAAEISTPRRARASVEFLKNEIYKLRAANKELHRKLRKANAKIENLNQTIQQVKNENFISKSFQKQSHANYITVYK